MCVRTCLLCNAKCQAWTPSAITVTTHFKHAQSIIQELPLDQFDAIVVMSGDGLIHEVLNGYAAHPECPKAFRIPLTPIPTGSGNGLAMNLYGSEVSRDAFDFDVACGRADVYLTGS